MPLLPANIASLQPYQAGRSVEDVCRLYGLDRAVKLASNENPLGPSPRAVEAMVAAAKGVAVYPSGGKELCRLLAEKFGVRAENVIAGSGAEGLISNIIRTFLCDGDEILTADVTFSGFRVLAQSRGVPYRTVPLRGWKFDLPLLADAVTERTKIIYLVNPNNPTGAIFTRAEFDRFYSRIPERVLIILDEAYYEYAKHDPAYPDSMYYRYDNVITLRTFSKAYGLAGARIGYGFAHENLISSLMKVKLPFEPSSLGEAAGIAALADHDHLDATLRVNAEGLAFVTARLREMGVEVLPSHANFVMTLWPNAADAQRIVESLMKSGVIVRPLAGFGVPNGVRITIGSREDNELLVSAMKQLVRIAEPALSR